MGFKRQESHKPDFAASSLVPTKNIIVERKNLCRARQERNRDGRIAESFEF